MGKYAVRLFFMMTTLALLSTAVIYQLRPEATTATTGQIRWIRDYQKALKLATRQNKAIITDLYTDWCKWCKVMDQKTFSDPLLVSESPAYVYLKLNAEIDPAGIELQRKFRVDSFPTTLILDRDGEEIDRINGYVSAESFRKAIIDMVQGTDSLGFLKRREKEDGSDLKNLMNLGRKYYQRQEFLEAENCFARIAQKDPSNDAGFTDTALFLESICAANLGHIDECLDILTSLRSAFPASSVVPEAELITGQLYMNTGRSSSARKVFEHFLALYPKHRMAEEIRDLLKGI